MFSNFYDTVQWKLSPLFYTNNINDLDTVLDQKEVLSLRHPDLLKILKSVIAELDFIHMQPSNHLLKNSLNGNASIRILAEEGKQYLLYLNNSNADKSNHPESEAAKVTSYEISLELPAGDYKGEWIDPLTGLRTRFSVRDHKGGIINFTTMPVREDLALKLTR